MLMADDGQRRRLWDNVNYFRTAMQTAGFTLAGSDHAIIPVMLGDASLAQEFASQLQLEGIYVTAFFYPVVPAGLARIRTQISAAHTSSQLASAVAAFTRVGQRLGVLV